MLRVHLVTPRCDQLAQRALYREGSFGVALQNGKVPVDLTNPLFEKVGQFNRQLYRDRPQGLVLQCAVDSPCTKEAGGSPHASSGQKPALHLSGRNIGDGEPVASVVKHSAPNPLQVLCSH